MPLTIPKIKNAQAQEKDYKLSDEKGLFLLVKKNGSKYWRGKYRFGGKEKLLALGIYPELSLKAARSEWAKARQQIADNIDPNDEKRKLKAAIEADTNTFEKVARDWCDNKQQGEDWTKTTAKKNIGIIEKDLIPSLGKLPIDKIETPTVLEALKKIEARGANETANRAKQLTGQIFRYAVSIGLTRYNPTSNFDKDSLKGGKVKHHPAITDPHEVGLLMLAIDGFQGTATVRAALKLSPLLFCRPGELRAMEWREIDWEQQLWDIPAKKMKMGDSHLVPLSTQSIAILKEQRLLTGGGVYVFPSARGASRCLSDNAVRMAIRAMGYDKDTMSAHGFRAMARTMLDEILEFKVEWIEQQLAHKVKDALGRAYNRTKHMPQRREMMQAWANYLDELKHRAKSGNVVSGDFKKL